MNECFYLEDGGLPVSFPSMFAVWRDVIYLRLKIQLLSTAILVLSDGGVTGVFDPDPIFLGIKHLL